MNGSHSESSTPSDSLLGKLLVPRSRNEETFRSSDVTAPDTLADDPLSGVLMATNPLLEAARPLLRALAEIPSLPFGQGEENRELDGEINQLRQNLIRDMHQFQYLCDRAGFRREQVVAARYCLCTALDEAVNKRLGSHSMLWTSSSLLLIFHNETSGGEKFFLLLGHMVQSPSEHAHVLEVLYHILSLGFEGRYALSMDGPRQLETIHRRLLAVLMEHEEPVPSRLAPHWQGASGGRMRFMHTVPVWVTACVLGIVLLALFTSEKADLVPQAEALTVAIEHLAETPTPKPLPVWPAVTGEPPVERWFTADELRKYGITVDVPAQTLRLPGNLTFVSGIELQKKVMPILDILAVRLKASSSVALVVGHTDNTRLRAGSVFRDNQHLSEERAKTLVRELVARGVAADRLRAQGKSDTAPLASNATADGRMKNRRVEVSLLPQEAR